MQSKLLQLTGAITFAEVGKLPYKIEKKKRYEVTQRYVSSFNKIRVVRHALSNTKD